MTNVEMTNVKMVFDTDLPDEIWQHIFMQGLRPRDLCTLSLTSHRFRVLVMNAQVFRQAMGEVGYKFEVYRQPGDGVLVHFIVPEMEALSIGPFVEQRKDSYTYGVSNMRRSRIPGAQPIITVMSNNIFWYWIQDC